MTEAEQIAQYLATKGATLCPPAFGGVKSSAGQILPPLAETALFKRPKTSSGKNHRDKRVMRQKWAWYGRSN